VPGVLLSTSQHSCHGAQSGKAPWQAGLCGVKELSVAAGRPGAAVYYGQGLHQAGKGMLLTAKRADVCDYIFNLIILEGSPPGWHQGRFADGGATILDDFEHVIIC